MTVTDRTVTEGTLRLRLPYVTADTEAEKAAAALINRTSSRMAEEIAAYVKSTPTVVRYTATHITEQNGKALTSELYLTAVKRPPCGIEIKKRTLRLTWKGTRLKINKL